MLKIEANTTHELIDFMWKNMTSGDLDIIRSFVDASGSAESIKERIPDKNLHGNESWLPEKKAKTDPKKEPPYDQETRKMIWSHRKAIGYTSFNFDKWEKIFLGSGWTYNTRKQAYEEYVKSMKQDLGCCEVKCEATAIPCASVFAGFAWANPAPTLGDILSIGMQPQKKEKNMYIEDKDPRTEAQQAKDYLIHSLNIELSRKMQDAVYEFGIEQKYPKTVGELRQAFKDGWLQLTIKEDTKDSKRIWSWMDYVTFENPEKKRDEEGYDAAVKAAQKAASDVKDQIVVMGPEKGLEALNAFKAETFH